MSRMLIYGGLGLLYGMLVQKAGFTKRKGLCGRTVAYLFGAGMIMTAVLSYLAVIDVDLLEILPLNSGVVIGGVLAGAAVGLCGKTVGTALCSIGGGLLLEGLSCAAGCAIGILGVRLLPMEPLRNLFPPLEGTLFRLTLDDPWLLTGGFGALACLGVLLCVIALLLRKEKRTVQTTEQPVLPEPEDELAALDALEDEVEETESEGRA